MPKVLYASASPYSAKVRMAAAYAGIPLEPCSSTPTQRPAELHQGQSARQDPGAADRRRRSRSSTAGRSRSISTGSRAARSSRATPAKRTDAERLEALADGICDCAAGPCLRAPLAGPRKWCTSPGSTSSGARSSAALDHLNAAIAEAAAQARRPGISRCAPRSAISICVSRENGRRGRAKLKRWAARFDEKFPELRGLSAARRLKQSRARGPAFATRINAY